MACGRARGFVERTYDMTDPAIIARTASASSTTSVALCRDGDGISAGRSV